MKMANVFGKSLSPIFLFCWILNLVGFERDRESINIKCLLCAKQLVDHVGVGKVSYKPRRLVVSVLSHNLTLVGWKGA